MAATKFGVKISEMWFISLDFGDFLQVFPNILGCEVRVSCHIGLTCGFRCQVGQKFHNGV